MSQTVTYHQGQTLAYVDAILAHWPYPVNKTATRTEMTQLTHQLFFAHLSPAEQQQQDIQDSMRNQGFGLAQDLYLRCRDWGFRLEDMQVPVVMQHSQTDDAVPFVTAQLTAARLPHCTLVEKAMGEHFSSVLLNEFIKTTMVLATDIREVVNR